METEYQKTQDSMEHYDRLIWSGSAFFIGIIAFISKILLDDIDLLLKELITIVIVILLFCMKYFVYIHGKYKNIKAKRLKELEIKLGFNQHIVTTVISEKLKKNKISGQIILQGLFSILIIFFIVLILYFYFIR